MSLPRPDSGAAPRVRIARGSLYLSRELCDRYLAGTTSIAAVIRDGRVYLLPLHGSTAGGSLLKVLNAHGDRVVHVDEFLRTVGVPVEAPEGPPARPREPSASMTSTSTVGLPRLSRISRPMMSTIAVMRAPG